MLTDDEFLAQGELIFDESVRQLDRELDRLDQYGGLLFFYFSSIDLTSHMFYRAIKDSANEHDRQYAHVIPDLYARIDVVIGQVLERAGPDTPVLVMSDHGFAPYNRHVHLNTWLANRGYLALQQGERGEGALGHIDWDNTQAYNLGLNQVFVNLQGREAHGAVPPEDKELVLDRLSRDLEAMRDPDTGASVVSRVFRPADGAFPERQPDLIVGFARGYRMSDESATGVVGDAAVTDNHSKWSGDHCMDPRLVPGVLFSTVPLTDEPVDLTDIAPSILRYFGVEPPAQMKGQSVFQADSGAGK